MGLGGCVKSCSAMGKDSGWGMVMNANLIALRWHEFCSKGRILVENLHPPVLHLGDGVCLLRVGNENYRGSGAALARSNGEQLVSCPKKRLQGSSRTFSTQCESWYMVVSKSITGDERWERPWVVDDSRVDRWGLVADVDIDGDGGPCNWRSHFLEDKFVAGFPQVLGF